MLRLALKYEKEIVSNSVVKEAREFACKMDLDLQTEFDGATKKTKNARELKRIAKEKGKRAIDIARKSKPLRGQYLLRTQKADVDLLDTYQCVRSEGFIITSLEVFRLIFFIMELILAVDSVLQAPRLLTTSSQGALFLPQMSIETGTIVLDNIYTEKL